MAASWPVGERRAVGARAVLRGACRNRRRDRQGGAGHAGARDRAPRTPMGFSPVARTCRAQRKLARERQAPAGRAGRPRWRVATGRACGRAGGGCAAACERGRLRGKSRRLAAEREAKRSERARRRATAPHPARAGRSLSLSDARRVRGVAATALARRSGATARETVHGAWRLHSAPGRRPSSPGQMRERPRARHAQEPRGGLSMSRWATATSSASLAR